jgi:diguanylate cyclase (GGDEF)-like protein
MYVWAFITGLFAADTDTLVKILFWGNLFSSVLVFAYAITLRDDNDRRRPLFFMVAKFVESLAWLFLLLDAHLPLVFSVHFGWSLLYAGLFIESLMLLGMSRIGGKKLVLVQSCVFAFVLVMYNVVSLFSFDIRFRFFTSAYSVFLILVLPGIVFMLGSGKSLLRKITGSLYVALFVIAFLGAGEMFSDASGRYFPSHLFQDLALVLFAVHMHIGGAGILLILKEEVDRKIADLAFRDPLTGLYNRRSFMESARTALSAHARYGDELSVLFLDLDFFKRVNDEHGHHFGDMVLRDFASVLKILVRSCDLACRYGGEEFVMLLSKTGKEGALAVAERVRQIVQDSRFPQHSGFSYTVSVGITHRVPRSGTVDALQSLIDESDAALYRAKEKGRDRIEFFAD